MLGVNKLRMTQAASIAANTEYLGTIVRIPNPQAVAAAWRELEQNCHPSFFLSWTWIGPWANLVSQYTELYLFTAEAGGSLVALCFLTISHVKKLKGLIHLRQVGLNEFMNHKCNMIIQYNGILARDQDRKGAWQALCNCLTGWDKKWDELALSSITQTHLNEITRDCHIPELTIEKVHREWRFPLAPEFADINVLINQFKSKSRHQLRQAIKSLEKELGQLSLAVASNVSEGLAYFENMGKLHTERWHKAGKAGSFANQNWVAFHQDIIRNEFANDRILLIAIKSGATVIGYLYGHVYQNVAYMQQTGFATLEHNVMKPGYVSHVFAMAYCAGQGLRGYDFLPDEDTSYKKFFTSPGEPIVWASFQKDSWKLRLEKLLRRMNAAGHECIASIARAIKGSSDKPSL